MILPARHAVRQASTPGLWTTGLSEESALRKAARHRLFMQTRKRSIVHGQKTCRWSLKPHQSPRRPLDGCWRSAARCQSPSNNATLDGRTENTYQAHPLVSAPLAGGTSFETYVSCFSLVPLGTVYPGPICEAPAVARVGIWEGRRGSGVGWHAKLARLEHKRYREYSVNGLYQN